MFASKSTDSFRVEGNRGSGLDDLEVEVAHAIPGRIRLRIAELKDRPELVGHIQSRLASLASLHSFEVNPRSNSLVVHYDATAESAFTDSLLAIFPTLDSLKPLSTRPGDGRKSHQPPDFAGDIANLFSEVNDGVEKATGGIDLKLLVPIALLAFSVLGMIMGPASRRKLPLPTWYELLWFAFNTFVILNLTMSKRKDSKRTEEEFV